MGVQWKKISTPHDENIECLWKLFCEQESRSTGGQDTKISGGMQQQ